MDESWEIFGVEKNMHTVFFFLGKLFLPLCFMSDTDYKFSPLNCNINVAGCKHTQMARHAAKISPTVQCPNPPGLLPSESWSFLPLLTRLSLDSALLAQVSLNTQAVDLLGFFPKKVP